MRSPVPSILLLAALSSAPSAAGVQEDMDAALTAARDGDRLVVFDIGAKLVATDPDDWRGWYVRFLALRAFPLDRFEARALEAVQPPENREVIRGLRGYLEAPRGARALLARSLAERFPRSGLARALVASSRLAGGDAKGAAGDARAALALDPDQVLAARVEISALDGLEAAETGAASEARACALLSDFPHDALVVEKALRRCVEPRPPGERSRIFLPLLEARRGTVTASIALGRLLQPPVSLPEDLLREVVGRLDPGDAGWWIHAGSLLEQLERNPAATDRDLHAFVERLWQAALRRPGNEEVARGAGLLLARSLDRRGSPEQARATLDSTLDALYPLRRGELLEESARLARKTGMPQRARALELDRHALTRPFQEPETSNPYLAGATRRELDARTEALLPRIAPTLLAGLDGTEHRVPLVTGRPTLFVFWSAYCGWVAQEAQRILSMRSDPGSVLSRRGVDVRWVHAQAREPREAVEERIESMGLDPASVFFEAGAAGERLHEQLRVEGSPWLALVTPGGQVLLEVAWFSEAGWADAVDAVLGGLEKRNTLSASKRGHR